MTCTLLLHGARLTLWNILEALISGEVHTEYPLHGSVMRSSGGDLDLWTSVLRWGEADSLRLSSRLPALRLGSVSCYLC